jgi:protein-L-isoaspartate(D-aspartate) O-methyltransferase
VSTDFAAEREQMVRSQLERRGIRDARVLAALRKVPRHRFCNPPGHPEAYADRPLSIGEGQTISQPYMVALMTERLRLTGTESVLEVGTGSGYQAAVLAELARKLVSVERITALAERARRLLEAEGYGNVEVVLGDGSLGRPDHGPYDRILVTAGAPRIPPALTAQLADGGVLVVPVGGRFTQTLTIITRRGDRLEKEEDCVCRFVKLVGEQAW